MIIELKSCPFCGGKATLQKGKKTGCQLHGEPMQAVIIQCINKECHVRPYVSAGDIYNGGEQKAKLECAELWNKRKEPSHDQESQNQE